MFKEIHLRSFKVNDPVIHVITLDKGEIIEVSERFGWARTRWSDGVIRVYNINDRPNATIQLDGDRLDEDSN